MAALSASSLYSSVDRLHNSQRRCLSTHLHGLPQASCPHWLPWQDMWNLKQPDQLRFNLDNRIIVHLQAPLSHRGQPQL